MPSAFAVLDSNKRLGFRNGRRRIFKDAIKTLPVGRIPFLGYNNAAIPVYVGRSHSLLFAQIRLVFQIVRPHIEEGFAPFHTRYGCAGGLLSLDAHKFRFYSNTLQAIGVGYLITSVVFINFKMRGRIACLLMLFAAYWLMLTFGGDFTPEGNFAEYIDRKLLGQWRDGVKWTNGEWFFSPNYRYTWIVSSLNFAVTVMLGAFSGAIMTGEDKLKNAKKMAVLSIVLIAAGLLLGLQMPLIKKIWSSSMTLFSGGLCMLAMAFFYYAIDCKGRLKQLNWLKIYGMNSIFAYVVSMSVNFRSIPESVFYGLKQYLLIGGVNYYPLLINFSQYAIIFALLAFMFKQKIFLKV